MLEIVELNVIHFEHDYHKKTNVHTATVPMLNKSVSSIFLGKILANNPYKRNPPYLTY